MAVDRGGLRYVITVKDEFSAATSSFITGIRAAKDEFAAFRSEVSKGRGAAASVRELAREAQKSAKASAKASDQQQAALKRLAEASRRQAALERESTRLRTTQQRESTRAQQAAIQAERRRLAAIQTTERAREREARRILASLRRDESAFHREQLRRIQELAARRADVERQRLQQSRAARAEQARLDRADPVKRGAAAAEEAIRRRATAAAELAELRRLGREDLITRQLRRQAGELSASARSANSLLVTFRRLVGVLAVFQIARALVQGFRDLIVEGVRFNDQIRQAEISITGLIVGLADVRDEQGRSVDLANEYARAQGEARRQVELLRQDALLTTATFEQLLDTFQIAIGPGFAAGLNLDEIRKLSVSISQAATAIGLPQNQLAEEIRSLLSGTIQARTTRIATALQITNADIRRLRATGELFDFLEGRFRALGLAAEQAARRTLGGIGQLVRDATSSILGAAAQPLFEELIRLGNELFDQVLTIRDAAGNIRPNPEAVRAFQTFFDALRDGVESLRRLGRELGFEGLRALVGTIGTALNVALQFAIGLALELSRIFAGLVAPIRFLGSLFGDTSRSIGDTARAAGRLAAIFLALRASARLFGLDLKASLSTANFNTFGGALRSLVANPLGLVTQQAQAAAKAIDAVKAAVARVTPRKVPAASPEDRAAAEAAASAARFGAIISNVESVVAQANDEIGQLDDNLRDVQARFDATGGRTGVEGFAADVEEVFSEAAASATLKTREIQQALNELRRNIALGLGELGLSAAREAAIRSAANAPAGQAQDRAIEALRLSEAEAKAVSLLRDEARLAEVIVDLRNRALTAANLEATIKARERTLELQRTRGEEGLEAQAAAEGAVADAVSRQVGARRLAALAAQNEANVARQVSRQKIADLERELAIARRLSTPITGIESTEDRARERERSAAARALVVELETTLELERDIADAKQRQLDFAREQARLAAEGNLTAGIEAGFRELADQLPTLFDAAKTIVQGITTSFVSAAGQLFRDLFDPRVEADAGVALGEFLLSAGQFIFEQSLQTLIQSLISSALTSSTIETTAATTAAGIKTTAATAAAATEVAAAQTAAAIRAGSVVGGAVRGGLVPARGFARGGRVDRVPSLISHARARGYARGGRPRGLDPRDTVPAWLQPGEFVVRKAVVDSLGAGFFQAVNAGRFTAPPAGAPAAGPGMAAGGPVIRREPAVPTRGGAPGELTVVPAVVTTEREMDRLSAGGKNAQLRFMRENAGTIRGILGI